MQRPSIAFAAVLALAPLGGSAQVQNAPSPRRLVSEAAQALGGEQVLRQVQTLQLYGFGENNAQDGGGNISAEAHAPQKRTALDGIVRSIDYTHRRMHLQQHQVQLFEFALANLMAAGNAVDQGLDGDVAFNVGAGLEAAAGPPRTLRAGEAVVRARRIEMLDNPLSIVRAALEGAQMGNVRRSAGDWLVDMRTAQGDQVTVAFAIDTHLPHYLRWVAPHPVYGDLTSTTWFTGYEPIGRGAAGNGLVLPFGYQTVYDYHDIVESEVYVDKYVVDGLSDAQRAALAAPADLRAQPATPRAIRIDATQVAPHVWYFHSSANGSSTVFDFTDHLTVFEAYGSEQNFEAILARIHQVLPGKAVTQLIVSHHHLDHTGGLRAAVGEGLSVITDDGANVHFVREVTARPAHLAPDVLQRSGRLGTVQIIPVHDRLVLKDANLEVDVLRVINNNHMANALIAYVPSAHTVSEGDLMDDTGWDASWWANSYPDTVRYWHLQVQQDLPVHGHPHTYDEMMQLAKKQTAGSEALCARARGAGFSLPGCPVANTMEAY